MRRSWRLMLADAWVAHAAQRARLLRSRDRRATARWAHARIAATHDAVDERRRWLRLGARELLAARTLGPCASEVVCAGAAGLLADTGLAARPHDFDTARAWEHQATAHAALAPVCGRALRGSHGAGRRARELLAERLRQTVAVLWLLNHRTTRPRGESDRAPAWPS